MHQLLTAMSPERFTVLYESLDPKVARALDGPIARMLNSRPRSIARQPVTLRVKALRAWITRERDEQVAGDLLAAYFLGPRKDLVTSFLDATGVTHEDGQVEDDARPDAAKIPDAVAALLAEHDREDVGLYLQVAAQQWPDVPEVKTAAEGLAPAQA
ncbi:MAG: hypothetical protein ACYTG2_01475 [Planctomycetota bacterium]|jgi:hypothetical protein